MPGCLGSREALEIPDVPLARHVAPLRQLHDLRLTRWRNGWGRSRCFRRRRGNRAQTPAPSPARLLSRERGHRGLSLRVRSRYGSGRRVGDDRRRLGRRFRLWFGFRFRLWLGLGCRRWLGLGLWFGFRFGLWLEVHGRRRLDDRLLDRRRLGFALRGKHGGRDRCGRAALDDDNRAAGRTPRQVLDRCGDQPGERHEEQCDCEPKVGKPDRHRDERNEDHERDEAQSRDDWRHASVPKSLRARRCVVRPLVVRGFGRSRGASRTSGRLGLLLSRLFGLTRLWDLDRWARGDPTRLRYRRLRCADDGVDRFLDGRLAVTGCGQKLLGAHTRPLDDDLGLRSGPLESLLDLGAGGVRQPGRLVARLLEEPVAARLGVVELRARVAVRLRQDLARLVSRGIEDLAALALGLLANACDLGLALLQVHLRLADLLLGLADLLGGRFLRVALDRVRELGRRANEVQGVHADGMPRRLGDRAARRGLQDSQLRLERGYMPAERIEGLTDLFAVEALARARDVLQPRQGCEGMPSRATWILTRHLLYASISPFAHGFRQKV